MRKKSNGPPDEVPADGWAIGPGSSSVRESKGDAGFRAWIDECLRDRFWWIRLPLLAWMVWIWSHHLGDPQYQSLLKGLNLGIHELGHIVFGFGEFLGVAGGSMLQCIVPVVGMAMFVRQRDPFAVAFGFGWLGTNFFDVATYAADARSMELPLVSPFAGDEIIHDWNWMLDRLGWLEHDQAIAGVLRFLGNGSFAVCVFGGAWILWRMARLPDVQSLRPLK